MGNTGGPSKGCNRCKRLKVKCDEAKPECLRCKHARQKCTGYADTFDILLRYETGIGNRRSTRSRKAVSTQKPPKSPQSRSSTKNEESLLKVFKAALGISYDANSPSDKYLERCISIMNDSPEGSSLKHAMSATFNGFYSFVFQSKETETAAETSFATAVSLVRAALDDPEESKSDATLLTVLMLSMFENLSSVKAYRPPLKTHFIGLAQLLHHRGPESLDSDISLFCLHQFYYRLAAVVLGGDLEAMKELLESAEYIPPPCDMHPTNMLASFTMRLARLRSQLEAINLCSRLDVQRMTLLISLAEQLEGDLSRWVDDVPASCHPKKVTLDFFLGYPDWEDKYPSLAVAQDWNHYRYLRIMTNIIISRCAALLRLYSKAAAADQTCEQMVDEVLASVNFYIGPLETFEDEGNIERRRKYRVLDEKYALAALGAMLLVPKLRWILQAEPSLRSKQRACLETQFKKILQFYRIHGVENVDMPDE